MLAKEEEKKRIISILEKITIPLEVINEHSEINK